MKQAGTTKDHIVPVMYLKRFAVPRSGGHQITAAMADCPEKDFRRNVRDVGAEKGFYWGVNINGVPDHQMEELLTLIESAATPAFRYILDQGNSPSDNALPNRWPTRPDVRAAVAWWLAAQILRTAPQRERLWRLGGDKLDAPSKLARANTHLALIIEGIAPLASLIFHRPWGIGLTSLCLLTSDVPVQLINAVGDDDPIRAAAYWDIYVPLDPHRFLFLPGAMHKDQRRLKVDHQINLSGGLAIPLNQQMIEYAHRHLFWHPNHDPRSLSQTSEAKSIRAKRTPTSGSSMIISYSALPPGYKVERRWLDKHIWDDGESSTKSDHTASLSSDSAVETANMMVERLKRAQDQFDAGNLT